MPRILIIVLVWCFFVLAPTSAIGISYQEGSEGRVIAEIQARLRTLGYNIDKVDGKYSRNVVRTVKLFQKKQGMKQTGIVDELTYDALFQVKPKAKVASDVKDSLANRIATKAMRYKGVPYRFGGTSPAGFDCSGFVWYIFKEQGEILPRTADMQYKKGKSVRKTELQRGDLVFFTTYEPGASHCGIYLESGKFIHASSSKGVMVSTLDDYYWKPRYIGARRVI